MPRGPKLQPMELSASETAQLTAWSRRRKTARALAKRARIIVKELTAALLSYAAEHNQHAAPFRWTKSADDILQKYQTILFAYF
jgi:hypothetical protein